MPNADGERGAPRKRNACGVRWRLSSTHAAGNKGVRWVDGELSWVGLCCTDENRSDKARTGAGGDSKDRQRERYSTRHFGGACGLGNGTDAPALRPKQDIRCRQIRSRVRKHEAAKTIAVIIRPRALAAGEKARFHLPEGKGRPYNGSGCLTLIPIMK